MPSGTIQPPLTTQMRISRFARGSAGRLRTARSRSAAMSSAYCWAHGWAPSTRTEAAGARAQAANIKRISTDLNVIDVSAMPQGLEWPNAVASAAKRLDLSATHETKGWDQLDTCPGPPAALSAASRN